jgi:sec-independent protein translocase protein TatC
MPIDENDSLPGVPGDNDRKPERSDRPDESADDAAGGVPEDLSSIPPYVDPTPVDLYPAGNESVEAVPIGDPPIDDVPMPGTVTAEEYAATPYLPPDAPIAEYEPESVDLDEIELEEEPRGRMGDMGFFDHLEELRWRIIKAVIALVGSSIVCAIFLDEIMNDIILAPARRAGIQLMNMQMMGQVTLAIQVALYSGLILSVPFLLWQVWGFIKPGLYPKERKYASLIAVATIACFLIGICFAYFLMIPTSVAFMKGVQFGPIENKFAIDSYFSFILGFILACGVVFEMPMLSFALARFGVVTPGLLRKYRRHAGVGILIIAAIITPTPDPFNQLMLAVPLYLLYELSIIVSRIAVRQRAEHAEERIQE